MTSPRAGHCLSINQHGRLASDWLAHLRGRSIEPFHVPLLVRFDGELNLASLEGALNAVVARHDALQMAFPDVSCLPKSDARRLLPQIAGPDGWSQSLLVPSIDRAASIALNVIPLNQSSVDAMDADFVARVQAEIARPFSYHRPPLVRATVFGAGARHFLLVVFHHLVADAWSMGVCVRELLRRYQEGVSGVPPNVSGAVVHVVDLARQQRATMSTPQARARLRVWQERYATCAVHGLTLDDLPLLARAQAETRVGVGTEVLRVDDAVAARLQAFCGASRVTPYMVCLSALAALCHLHCHRNLMTFWGGLANRRQRTEDVIGWLAEGRLIGIAVAPEMSFSDVIASVRDLTNQLLADSYLPMAAIHHGSYRQRQPSLYGARALHLSLQMAPPGHAQPVVVVPDKLSATVVDAPYAWRGVVPSAGGPSDIKFVVRTGPHLSVRCTYARQRIHGRGATALLAQFGRLLDELVTSPARRLGACTGWVRNVALSPDLKRATTQRANA